MSLKKCRECGESVSTEAKTCPHCGIKKPYRKEWKDQPVWVRLFTIFITIPLIALILFGWFWGSLESTKLKRVKELPETALEKKFNGWANLFHENPYNDEYADMTLKYGTAYVATVPVTDPNLNLKIYRILEEIAPQNDYSAKINKYKLMTNVSAITDSRGEQYIKSSLAVPNSYDPNFRVGEWKNGSTYVEKITFNSKNRMGVEFTNTYVFKSTINWKTGNIVTVFVGKK